MIFLPAFLDSSDFWNTDHNQLQLQQIGTSTHSTTTPSPAGPGVGGCNSSNQKGAKAGAGSDAGGGDDDGCGGAVGGNCGVSGNSKSMPMSEQARLAQLPQPVPGLNCPRCDSTDTKFCYFNNYSLTQPRHFCRSCRRYWTRGGTLRNVPVGGGYRRHAKRMAKPKVVSATSRAATVGMSSVTSTMSSSATYATGMGIAPAGLLYPIFGSTPWHDSQFADNFGPAILGLSFPNRLLFADNGAYVVDGCAQQHNQHAHGNRTEQWAAAQTDNFPFMHAMDHQISGLPTEAMPITMATMQGMFHLGLQSVSGGNGDDRGGHRFHHPPAKRYQKEKDYLSRGMYGDVVNGNGCGGYI